MWFVFAILAALIWGLNYAASGRVLSRGLSPSGLFLMDISFGLLVVGAITIATGKVGRIVDEVRGLGPDLLWLGVAMVSSTAAGVLIFMAIEGKNATVASLIEISYPMFVAVFAWVLFRETQMNVSTLIGAALIISGVVVVWSGNR